MKSQSNDASISEKIPQSKIFFLSIDCFEKSLKKLQK